MPMPPNMESSRLFAEITAIPRPSRLVPFPRNKPNTNEAICEVAMVILTQQEILAVSTAAEKTVRRLLGADIPNKEEHAKGYNEIFNQAQAVELLYRACKDPEDENLKKPFFPSKDAIMEVLSTDEVAILLNHYFTLQAELGPIVAGMNDDEIEAWIKKLAEGGASSLYFLNSLSWEALKILVLSMAFQLFNSQTDKSLPTGQPEENQKNEEKSKPRKSKITDPK